MTDQSPSGGFLTPGRILALVVLLGVVGVVMMEKSAQNQAQAAFDKLPEEGSFGDWNLPQGSRKRSAASRTTCGPRAKSKPSSINFKAW